MDKQAKNFVKGWEDYKVDKQKQIKEMAKVIYKSADCNGTLCQDCKYHKKGKVGETNCQSIKIATELLKYYQPKISENAVKNQG